MDNGGHIRYGDIFMERGRPAGSRPDVGPEHQGKSRGRRMGESPAEPDPTNEKQKTEELASRHNLTFADISDISVDGSAVELIPRQMALKYCILPVNRSETTLTVLTDDPMNFYGFEDVRQVTGLQLEIMLTDRSSLMRAIAAYYTDIDARRAARKANLHADKLPEPVRLAGGEDDTPVINLLNSLVQFAYTFNASDIHIEPFEDGTLVRMRLDGVIIDYQTLQKSLHSSLVARIKILSDLDIAEHRIPQDGHARLTVNGVAVNIRVSLIPTVFGEKAVLRILDANTAIDYSGTFGMRQNEYEKFVSMLRSPNGIIYLTGPTGSGKTTTLYLVLEYLSSMNLNISTIEDPVEKTLRRVNQMQVNNQAGLTFEAGLKALLRQDPDIIMVGETRDPETASISVRAAITGHLVLSTLHTSDACGSVIRLLNMGLEPYLLADSLAGAVAQRLVRKVCRHCSAEVEATAEEIRLLGAYVHKVRKARGCPFCNHTGYKGRAAIHEIFAADAQIRRLIAAAEPPERLKKYAVEAQGMLTLKDAAARLVSEGVTTIEEFIKISYGG